MTQKQWEYQMELFIKGLRLDADAHKLKLDNVKKQLALANRILKAGKNK